MRPLVDGCAYVKSDGSRGWYRQGGAWWTAVADRRPAGSHAPYLNDTIVLELAEGNDNPGWILTYPDKEQA